jgi:hypothetical protein
MPIEAYEKACFINRFDNNGADADNEQLPPELRSKLCSRYRRHAEAKG